MDKVNDESGFTALVNEIECARFAQLVAEECAKVCEKRMDEAERESGPEAAGHLEFVADAIRRG